MKALKNNRDFSIKINGNHFFAGNYIYTNIYGNYVFENLVLDENVTGANLKDSDETLQQEYKNNDNLDLQAPDCTTSLEYTTEGSVIVENDDIYIRYGNDDSPMCIHILEDGRVTLSEQEYDAADFIFEKGKQNFISLPAYTFLGADKTQEDDFQSAFQLCVDTDTIKHNMGKDGGTLTVSYTILVNGLEAEKSEFTLTAFNLVDNVAPDYIELTAEN